MPRQLKVKLSDLTDALENASYEQIYVLDMDTGEVLWSTDEDSRLVDEIFSELRESEDDAFAAFEAALERGNLPDWQKDSLREAARIEQGFGTRYRRIEPHDPHADYRDMEAFVETVEDVRLRERLERAISGRGAFRYFKDVLLDHPQERERWFQFKEARLRERALEWLRAEGIEPTLE